MGIHTVLLAYASSTSLIQFFIRSLGNADGNPLFWTIVRKPPFSNVLSTLLAPFDRFACRGSYAARLRRLEHRSPDN